jgi:hypothetical protein
VLKPDADEKKAEHVGEEMEEAGMKPYAGEEAPALVGVDHLGDIERAHLVQSGFE